MNILGISCYYHDAAAALIKDGKIVAAAEEERFSRKKHDSGFPKHAIDFCLRFGNIKSSYLDYVVFYEKPFRKFHRILLSSLATYPRSCASFREGIRIWLTQKLWVKQEIASYLNIDLDKILFCEHHLSHAASCFYPSPFEKSTILTLDGVGEWTTAAMGIGEKNKINLISEIHFPQSLGLFYSAYTAFLGFEVNEGEWKVMGLAPYGKPRYADKIRKTVRQYADGSFSLDFSYFSYHYSDKKSFSDKLIKLLGQPIDPKNSHLVSERSADIAASVQLVTEELILGMAKWVQKETGLPHLCLAGGVALNSVANFRILNEGIFKNIFVQPAAGDSGGALGAALYVYYHVLDNPKINRKRLRHARRGGRHTRTPPTVEETVTNPSLMTNAYFGEQWSNEEVEEFLKEIITTKDTSGVAGIQGLPRRWRKLTNEKLIDYISDQITKGRVIGWMQGRFEWGPRALGDRSILADARNPKMKDIINSKVKFREAFRPFAPSVLSEYAEKVFDLPMPHNHPRGGRLKRSGSHDSPGVKETEHYPLRFMLYVVPVKKEWRKKVPAINHADNTARPQLVFKEENPLYHKLISAFYKKTGVPLILNTSFNLKGEPIVASPQDAYSTFIRSGIDILVMGNFVCEKK